MRLPRVAAPLATEAWYAAELERIATAVAELVAELLLPVLRELAAEQARADADDAPPPVPIKILQGLDRFRVKVSEIAGKPHAQVVAQAADKVEVYNGSNVADVVRGLGLSVKPVEANAYLQAARSKFMRDNTALIKDIPEEMRQRIEDKVRAGVESGKRWETLAKDLEEEGGIGQRRARLIARDQVNKYNGALTQARQQKLGISHFRWQGAMDARERPEHIALNGKVFAWDAPPPCGAPGQPIQCRCVAIPVVSDAEKAKAVTMTEADLEAATQQALAEHGGRAKRSREPLASPRGGTGVTGPVVRKAYQVAGAIGQSPHRVFDLPDSPSIGARARMGEMALVEPHLLDRAADAHGRVVIIDGEIGTLPELIEWAADDLRRKIGLDGAAGIYLDHELQFSRPGPGGRAFVGTGNGHSIATAPHEFAHMYEDLILLKTESHRSDWRAIHRNAMESGAFEKLTTNPESYRTGRAEREWFAESFALYHAKPNKLRKYARSTFDYLAKVLAK